MMRKRTLIPVLIVIVLSGICTWMFYRSGWSWTQLKKIISEKHFSCLISHSFEKANCLHGKQCKECGLEVGGLGDHEWTEATCVKPKQCSVCGVTDGVKLGHTTRIGRCDRCGKLSLELANEKLQIERHLIDANADLSTALEWLKSCSQATTQMVKDLDIQMAKLDMSHAQDDLEAAAEACGTYEEFKKLKSSITAAANALEWTQSRDLKTVSSKFEICLEHLKDITLQLNNMME